MMLLDYRGQVGAWSHGIGMVLALVLALPAPLAREEDRQGHRRSALSLVSEETHEDLPIV